VSAGADATPPRDNERRRGRGLALPIVFSLVSVVASMATTWGAFGTRIEKVEEENRDIKQDQKQLRDLLGELATRAAVNQQQGLDIIRRLERMEFKIDRDRDR
jgi:hypothetical protein